MVTRGSILFVLLAMLPATPVLSQKAPDRTVTQWIKVIKSADRTVQLTEAYASLNLEDDPKASISALIACLRDENPYVRCSAVNALGELSVNPELTVPALIDALKDKDEQVRKHSVIALSKLGSPAVPFLIEALQQRVIVDPSKRIGKDGQTSLLLSDLATAALMRSEAHIVGALFSSFRKIAEGKRGLAAQKDGELTISSLGRNIAFIFSRRGKADVAELIPLLDDQNADVRLLALDSLGMMRSTATSAVPALAKIAKSDTDPLATGAVSALGRIGPGAIPELAEILRVHSSPLIRADAADLLAWTGRGAVPSLVKALQTDPTAKVRRRAAYALAEIKPDDETALLALAKALRDPDTDTRRQAAYALREITTKSSPSSRAIVPELIAGLQIKDGQTVAFLASALANLGADAKDAVPVLLDVLRTASKYKSQEESTFGDLQRDFILAVGAAGAGNPDALSVLNDILKDKTRKAYHDAAIFAVGELGKAARSSVPLLVDKFKDDSDQYERYDIARALARIQPDGITALLDIFWNVREAESSRLAACDAFKDVIKLDRRIVIALRSALTDPGPRIRACAAVHLAGSGDATDVVISTLGKAFVEDGSSERQQALIGLGSKSVPTLIKLLQHSSPAVREQAAETLGSLRLRFEEATPAIGALLALLHREIVPGADYRAWRQMGPGSYGRFPVPAAAAFGALQHFGSYSKQALPDLRGWMTNRDSFVRVNAIEVLGSIGTSAKSAKAYLIDGLKDKEPSVQITSAQALLAIGFELGELDPIFNAVMIDAYIDRSLEQAYRDIADALRPSNLISGPRFQLPEFPWPNPPTPAHIAVFGRQIPREFLGADATTLEAVYERILRALTQTDPNFESGVFGVPGGFAVLAKTERINEDGTPLPGEYRWALGYVPPRNLGDYIGQLFSERPGYFRVLAFVISTEKYRPQDPSTNPLPSISEGATELPGEIAAASFRNKRAYVLVYSFKRFRGGAVTDFKLSGLSALTHLERSGVLEMLKAR
jgi:HEAT repeat protein